MGNPRIGEALVAWRRPLLLLAVVLGVVCALPGDAPWVRERVGHRVAAWLPGARLDFDRSIENMFAADDPLLVPYTQLKERFGGNELVLCVYRDPDLLAEDGRGIRRLGRIADRLREVGGVEDVLSLAELDQVLSNARPRLLGPPPEEGTSIVDDTTLASNFRSLFQGYTHDATGQVAAVACMLQPRGEAVVPRRTTILELRERMQSLPDDLPPGMIAGEPVMVVDGFRYVEEDGRRLGYATTLLLGLTVVLLFRSLRWVLVPLAVVQLALLLTRATLVWSGIRLSMVSSMLTAIVTVVGVATVVHVIVRFRQARETGADPISAMRYTIGLLAAPVFWACTTDAVGFLSLIVADVGPVHDFGIMMAIGSLMVLVSAVLVVPGVGLIGRLDGDPQQPWGEGGLNRGLRSLSRNVQRFPLAVGAAVLLLAAAAIGGVFRLEVETDFTRNFRQNSPIVVSYRYIEDNLGGAGVWDVLVPGPCSYDAAFVSRLSALEEDLRRIPSATDPDKSALTQVISLADALEQSRAGPLALVPAGIRLAAMEESMTAFAATLRTREPDDTNQCYWRIMLRSYEQQPAGAKQELIAAVERIAETHFPPSSERPAPQVTGFYVLLTNLIQSMIRDQWVCFLVATIGIGLMLTVAFRSPWLALIGLVPNVLPILLVLGGMGWIGIEINMGAAMIAAVSMGLSVDSSIHYVVSFRRARLAGASTTQALDDVQQTVGRAMFFSTVSLIVGFLALCTSGFVPTIYFGALVSLAMLGGMFGNLVVLPLLLSSFTRESAVDPPGDRAESPEGKSP